MRHVAAALGVCLVSSAAAQTTLSPRKPGEMIFTRLPGLLYLPSHVMEKNKLVEKHAARLGLPDLAVRWLNIRTGDIQRAALMSGQADVVVSGLVPLMRLWDTTNGDVKAIVASGVMPFSLVSADPRIRSLRDIVADDRIAVPVLQFSTQAVLLQLAACQLYGPDAWRFFDKNCVAMPHSAAFAALMNRDSAVRLHFAPPPFPFYVLRKLRNAHVVTTSPEILGGSHSIALFYSTTRFAQENPLIVTALRAAAFEAKGLIEKKTQECVASYRDLSGDKSEAADILEALAEPGMMNWQLEPTGTMAFAEHLHRIGALKRKPESWRDYFQPASHDMLGS